MTPLEILSSIILFLSFCPQPIFFFTDLLFKIYQNICRFIYTVVKSMISKSKLPEFESQFYVSHLEWYLVCSKVQSKPSVNVTMLLLGFCSSFLSSNTSYWSTSRGSYYIKDLRILNYLSQSLSENIFNLPSVLNNYFLGIEFYVDMFPQHLKLLLLCLPAPIIDEMRLLLVCRLLRCVYFFLIALQIFFFFWFLSLTICSFTTIPSGIQYAS